MRSKRPSHKGLLEEVESFMAEHGIFRDDASSQVMMHIERFFQGGTSLLYLVVSSPAPKHVTYTRLLSAASSHVLLPGTCEETFFERISFQRRHRQGSLQKHLAATKLELSHPRALNRGNSAGRLPTCALGSVCGGVPRDDDPQNPKGGGRKSPFAPCSRWLGHGRPRTSRPFQTYIPSRKIIV